MPFVKVARSSTLTVVLLGRGRKIERSHFQKRNSGGKPDYAYTRVGSAVRLTAQPLDCSTNHLGVTVSVLRNSISVIQTIYRF
jgi:hypothetical protein